MVKRTKTGQRQHDSEVKKQAVELKRQGFDVKADLPGMKKPPSIGGRVPDVFATKGSKTKTIEVETESSMRIDLDQRRKFRDWSKKSKNRTFVTKIVKKKNR